MRELKGKDDLYSLAMMLAGMAGLVMVAGLDKFHWKTEMLMDSWPDLSRGHIVRSMFILFCVAAMIGSVIRYHRPQFSLRESDRWSLNPVYIVGSLCISLVFLFLFLFATPTFTRLSKEDSFIEWGSFVFLIGSCIAFMNNFLMSRNRAMVSGLTRWTMLLFAFLFFVMAMEEVSWFQRVFEIRTPASFNENEQNEINLHNFETDFIENVFYLGAFLFLVVAPFIRAVHPPLLKYEMINTFAPPPYISLVGAMASAYNFDMWNIIFTQLQFFGTVVILLVYSFHCLRWEDRRMALFTVLIITITQLCFITNGEKFFRMWDVTEYKEFLIALAFFVYAIDVYGNFNRSPIPMERTKSTLANTQIFAERH